MVRLPRCEQAGLLQPPDDPHLAGERPHGERGAAAVRLEALRHHPRRVSAPHRVRLSKRAGGGHLFYYAAEKEELCAEDTWILATYYDTITIC